MHLAENVAVFDARDTCDTAVSLLSWDWSRLQHTYRVKANDTKLAPSQHDNAGLKMSTQIAVFDELNLKSNFHFDMRATAHPSCSAAQRHSSSLVMSITCLASTLALQRARVCLATSHSRTTVLKQKLQLEC